MDAKFRARIKGWDARTMKTSELLANYSILHFPRGDLMTPLLIQTKIKELADEIDRRLPGP